MAKSYLLNLLSSTLIVFSAPTNLVASTEPPLNESEPRPLLNVTHKVASDGSACQTNLPRSGPKVRLSQGRPPDSLTGDGDLCIDNHERTQVFFEINNFKHTPETIKITEVQLMGPEGAALYSLEFDDSFFELPGCESMSRDFIFAPINLNFDERLQFRVCLSHHDASTSCRDATVTSVLTLPSPTQCDQQAFESKTWDFNDLAADQDQWITVQGTFVREEGEGDGFEKVVYNEDKDYFMQSSSGINNQCDQIRSPLVVLSEKSALSLRNKYEIDPQSEISGLADSANVAFFQENHGRTVVYPDGGRLYNVEYNFIDLPGGCETSEAGWAGFNPTWESSTWSSSALGTETLMGRVSQIDVMYSTNEDTAGNGFGFDFVTLTDFDLLVPDPTLFTDGFEGGNASAWSNTRNFYE